MTYHSVCKTNDDYISALRWARNISANITRTMNNWPWNNVSEPEPKLGGPYRRREDQTQSVPLQVGLYVLGVLLQVVSKRLGGITLP